MAVKKIITYPDKRLRVSTSSVETVDDDIQRIITDLCDTMDFHKAAGIAANQVGYDKNIFIIASGIANLPSIYTGIPFINPNITFYSEDKHKEEEGCLSFPGYFAEIERSNSITISFQDIHGTNQSLTVDGFFAKAIQHEYDHLTGKLMVDLLPKNLKMKVADRFMRLKVR